MSILLLANQHQKKYRIINLGNSNQEEVLIKVQPQGCHLESKLVYFVIIINPKKSSILKQYKEKTKMMLIWIKF